MVNVPFSICQGSCPDAFTPEPSSPLLMGMRGLQFHRYHFIRFSFSLEWKTWYFSLRNAELHRRSQSVHLKLLNINSQPYELYADYQEYVVSTDTVAISHTEMTHPQPIPLGLLWQQAVVFLQTEVFFWNLQTICIRHSLCTPTASRMSNRGPQELDGAGWMPYLS